MRLTELLAGQPQRIGVGTGGDEIDIVGLAADSRQVQPGWLFAALPGVRADGRSFIDDAIRRGAVAVLAPPGTLLPGRGNDEAASAVRLIIDDNPRCRLAFMAARFYGQQPATMAAVTGTNGKTSVVWFLRQIWTALGHSAACIGTLGLHAPGLAEAGALTTPDPVVLAAMLARLKGLGVDRVAMEASSHGLAQYRLEGVRVSLAAFTNLSRDHLDYHGTVDAYFAAKLRLFDELLIEGGSAVVNADSPYAPQLLDAARRRTDRVLTYGHAGADLRIDRLEPTDTGQRIEVSVFGRRLAVTLPLAGAFQASNAVAAAALAIASGDAADRVLAGLAGLQPVPGRLERVASPLGAHVYVDYAHTPDALDTVLSALRPTCRGRLGIVFGCGGDRDTGKRPEMGRIAARLADRIIVTDDNPRTEEPSSIRRAIIDACPRATEIGDRAEAIRAAMQALEPGDVLLVAGKGHESGQIVGNGVLPFDDREVVRAIVEQIPGAGPAPKVVQ